MTAAGRTAPTHLVVGDRTGRTGRAGRRGVGRAIGVAGMVLRNSRLVLVVPAVVAAALFVLLWVLGVAEGRFPSSELDREQLFEEASYFRVNLAACAILGAVAACAVRSADRTFRQAVRLGFARAEVLRGTALSFLLVAAATAATVVLLQALERATIGFGAGMLLFDVPGVGRTPLWTFAQTATIVLMLLVLGAAVLAFRQRTGSVVVPVIVALIGVALVSVVLFGFGVVIPALGLGGTVRLVLGLLVVLAGAAWVPLLRRAPVD